MSATSHWLSQPQHHLVPGNHPAWIRVLQRSNTNRTHTRYTDWKRFIMRKSESQGVPSPRWPRKAAGVIQFQSAGPRTRATSGINPRLGAGEDELTSLSPVIEAGQGAIPPSSASCSFQALRGLDEAHTCGVGVSALRHPPIGVLISSEDTLPDTRRNSASLGIPGPRQTDAQNERSHPCVFRFILTHFSL